VAEETRNNSINNLLVIPVNPGILSAALALHKQCPELNLVVYVMDDWQGHYECLKLPYSRWRKRLLTEVIDPATVRFAVSRETAAHYEEIFGNSWLVVHNRVAGAELIQDETLARNANDILPLRRALGRNRSWYLFWRHHQVVIAQLK
jgi:hypothetical protein